MASIAVVGAGVIGLSSAVTILERDPTLKVTLVADSFSPNITSDGAAGLILPFKIGNTPIPLQRFGYSFSTLFVNGKQYNPWLLERFQRLGGSVVKKTINSLEELAGLYDVVVNCSGMRARELVNDLSMDPIRGQVLRVYAPWVKQAYFREVKHLVKQERYCYILPQANGEVALGGTGYHNNFNTKVSADDTRHILEVTSQLIPSLKRAPVLEAWVGLRPGRPRVRLEKEVMKFKDKLGEERSLKVVHNYGHGGGGVTFHWGCATDTADLVFQFLAEGQKAKL